MSQPLSNVSPQWISELAEITAMTLADFRREMNSEIASFAVECHPSDGIISLALLTAAEAIADTKWLDPGMMQSWRHYGFERKTGMWRLAAGVERVMQESYHCAPDASREAVGKAYVRACADAMQSPRVGMELKLFQRSADFGVSVPVVGTP